MKPINGYVVLEPVPYDGSDLVPEQFRNKSNIATVFAIHDGVLRSDGVFAPCKVKVGQKVMFRAGVYGNDEVKMSGKDYLIVDEDDLMLVLDE
jgi:co-chaperonin GroES (HSP10)